MNRSLLRATALAIALGVPAAALAETYVIDTAKAHASIHFRIKHLGYSWLYGRFDDFSGSFSYDEADPGASRVDVTIKTASVDSNEAERDKHLRSSEFLNVARYPEASAARSTPSSDSHRPRCQLQQIRPCWNRCPQSVPESWPRSETHCLRRCFVALQPSVAAGVDRHIHGRRGSASS